MKRYSILLLVQLLSLDDKFNFICLRRSIIQQGNGVDHHRVGVVSAFVVVTTSNHQRCHLPETRSAINTCHNRQRLQQRRDRSRRDGGRGGTEQIQCQQQRLRENVVQLRNSRNDEDNASKGLVTTLTNLVNWWSDSATSSIGPTDDDDASSSIDGSTTLKQATKESLSSPILLPPTTSTELLQRLQDDYSLNNYLWTGNIDTTCFETNCKFQDPTISFVGLDTFLTNTQNLVPIVETVCNDGPNSTQSILLDIADNVEKQYIETRWNMVGNLTGSIFQYLWFTPQINVIGRTKFWYRRCQQQQEHPDDQGQQQEATTASTDGDSSSFLKVYFYDEEWEIPAYQALLQIITPAGTFPNSKTK